MDLPACKRHYFIDDSLCFGRNSVHDVIHANCLRNVMNEEKEQPNARDGEKDRTDDGDNRGKDNRE